MGTIVGAHALRGMLRVRVDQPTPPGLTAGRSILLEHAGRHWSAQILSVAAHGRGLVLLSLDGIVDRTAAEGLTGTRLLIPVGELFVTPML